MEVSNPVLANYYVGIYPRSHARGPLLTLKENCSSENCPSGPNVTSVRPRMVKNSKICLKIIYMISETYLKLF
jgi:hypothetical protein